MHAPLESHAETFVPILAPKIHDDGSTHSYHDSYLSFEHDEEHEHEHVDLHPFSHERTRILRDIYAQTTPEDVGDLMGDPMDPRRT